MRHGSRSPKTFATADGEKSTYKRTDLEKKKEISNREILDHWDLRAQRPDVQAVMSARHPLEANLEAALKLKEEIFQILHEEVKNKRIFELGVGIGRMTSELALVAKEVVGCDISRRMLERARKNLEQHQNITLYEGKITKIGFGEREFDLVFEAIVLLHILSDRELRETARRMQQLSKKIFIVEHIAHGEEPQVSRYTILRSPQEYKELFSPYRLKTQKEHLCAGDTFALMLFEKD